MSSREALKGLMGLTYEIIVDEDSQEVLAKDKPSLPVRFALSKWGELAIAEKDNLVILDYQEARALYRLLEDHLDEVTPE